MKIFNHTKILADILERKYASATFGNAQEGWVVF